MNAPTREIIIRQFANGGYVLEQFDGSDLDSRTDVAAVTTATEIVVALAKHLGADNTGIVSAVLDESEVPDFVAFMKARDDDEKRDEEWEPDDGPVQDWDEEDSDGDGDRVDFTEHDPIAITKAGDY